MALQEQKPDWWYVAAVLRWNGWAADVATAFLQGKPRQGNFGFAYPATVSRSLVVAQKLALDAPRRWWQEATRRLTQEGWTAHDLDPCLFVLHHPQEDGSTVPCGLVALHVDDMLGAGDRNCPTYAAAERRLKEVFDFPSWQEDHETMEYFVTARTTPGPCHNAISCRKSNL